MTILDLPIAVSTILTEEQSTTPKFKLGTSTRNHGIPLSKRKKKTLVTSNYSLCLYYK